MSRFTSFLTAALVSCGLVLAANGVASAQHHGGGGHSGGHSSGGHYSGGHYSGGGHYYGGRSYGGYRYGPSIIIGGYPRYYGGGYYGGGYDGGYYYPDTVAEPQYSESYYEPQPAPSVESSAVTSLRVIKPSADAALGWMGEGSMERRTRTSSSSRTRCQGGCTRTRSPRPGTATVSL